MVTKLNEMAYSKSFILDKAESFSDEIAIHIIKCIAYKNMITACEFWKKEIAGMFERIGEYKMDKNKRLTEKDLMNAIYKPFIPDGFNDAKAQLKYYGYMIPKSSRLKEKNTELTAFDPNDNMVKEFINKFKNVIKACSVLISDKYEHDTKEYYNAIKDII